MLNTLYTIIKYIFRFIAIIIKITINICKLAFIMCNYKITQMFVSIMTITYINILELNIVFILFIMLYLFNIYKYRNNKNIPINIQTDVLDLEIGIISLHDNIHILQNTSYTDSKQNKCIRWVDSLKKINVIYKNIYNECSKCKIKYE